jgi:hypothetical protein
MNTSTGGMTPMKMVNSRLNLKDNLELIKERSKPGVKTSLKKKKQGGVFKYDQ